MYAKNARQHWFEVLTFASVGWLAINSAKTPTSIASVIMLTISEHVFSGKPFININYSAQSFKVRFNQSFCSHFSMSVSSGDSDDDIGVDRVDGTSSNKVRQRSSSNIGGVVTGR